MDVQLTVEGYVLAAKLWELLEADLRESAVRIGGDYWRDWQNAGDRKRRCMERAIELLGSWDRLTDEEKSLLIPF